MTVMMTPLQRVATIPLLSRLWRTSLQLTPSLSKRLPPMRLRPK